MFIKRLAIAVTRKGRWEQREVTRSDRVNRRFRDDARLEEDIERGLKKINHRESVCSSMRDRCAAASGAQSVCMTFVWELISMVGRARDVFKLPHHVRFVRLVMLRRAK